MPIRILLSLLALCASLAAGAAPPLAPEVQDELDRAVIAYESGQLESARAAFESLAQRHVPAAEFNLAVMHLRAEVPRPDTALALVLLERAARGGFVTAQLMFARTLEAGAIVPRDLVQAGLWYEVAARAGSVEAQVEMGTAYYLGRGRPQDPMLAAQWFREAAKGGDIGAMYLLASMYEHGDGVERDLRLARYWYDIAARNGDEAAPGKVRELDALLPQQPS